MYSPAPIRICQSHGRLRVVFLCYVAAQLQKVFLPHETTVFVRLLKYGLVALDIYRITVLPNGVHILRNANCQTVKTKEEKEVLEHFAGVVSWD